MKNNKPIIIGGIFLALLLAWAMTAPKQQPITIVDSAAAVNAVAKSTLLDTITFQKDPMSDIRSREDIKRQQELIVDEAYQNDQKVKITAERDAADAKYAQQLSDIEKQLEAIRKEKLSLARAPLQ